MELELGEFEAVLQSWIDSQPEFNGMDRHQLGAAMAGRYGVYARLIKEAPDYDRALKVAEQMAIEHRLNNRVQLRIKMLKRGLMSVGEHSIIKHVDHPLLGIMAQDYTSAWFNPTSSEELDFNEQAVLDFLTNSLLDIESEFDLDEIDVDTLALVPPACETTQ